MNEFTPEQKKQLSVWVLERDSILKDISNLKIEFDKLISLNRDLSNSNTEITNKVQRYIGRIEELSRKEQEIKNMVSIEVLNLKNEKTILETTVSSLKNEIIVLNTQKDKIKNDIEFLNKNSSDIFIRANELDKSVGITISSVNDLARFMEVLIDSINNKAGEIIKLSTKNIDAHNLILNKIPELFIELRRKSLIREKI